jgi:hypothetical protein
MLIRALLAGLALATTATASEAGPFRRRARPAYPPAFQPVYPSPTVVVSPEAASGSSPAVTTVGYSATPVSTAGGSDGDGLAEVNAKRAACGLRPFVRDEGLTQAARSCAQYRAAYGLFGHTANDFSFVPAGTCATSAGCAAYPAADGWLSCCMYDNYTYAGASWVTGRDGRRYMHLFVR